MRDDLQHMRDKATELELKVDRVRGRGPCGGGWGGGGGGGGGGAAPRGSAGCDRGVA